MRIKKIEASGFKSFADKQTVHVDDHVTAVIGPNGCGKSNIVDAVRWCLGEQRAKHLRGSGMNDVIFSGTATRGPGASAEVTITFENEGDAPAAHLNFRDIAVTRRLYRDGTSEYLINKAQCRLRDISDLLSGTGVGTRGYSVIEQGRVSDLVVSKPENRRLVIDEAAGVTKFKAQKATAERRIDQTRQNLLRVTDVVTELEGRLTILERQAQKAERYKRYRDEQRDLELWIASHRFLELRAMDDVLRGRHDRLENEVSELRHSVELAETRSEAMRIEVQGLEQGLVEAQKAKYDLENRIQLNVQDRKFRAKERETALQASATALRDAERARASLSELAEERSSLDAQLSDLGSDDGEDSETERCERLASAQDDAVAEHRRVHASFEGIRQERAEAQTRQAGLRERSRSLDEALADLRTRRDHAVRELDELESGDTAREEHENAQEQARAARLRVDEANRAIKDLDSEHGESSTRLRSLETRRAECTEREVELRTRLRSLTELQTQHRACTRGVKALLAPDEDPGEDESTGETARPDLAARGLLADKIHAPERFEAALAAMLGESLQSIVIDDRQTGRDAIAWLRDTGRGRVSLLARDLAPSRSLEHATIPERSGIVGRLIDLIEIDEDIADQASLLIGNTIVVDSLESAFELRVDDPDPPHYVSTSGDIVFASGQVVGGDPGAVESALLQQKRDIESCAAELDEARSALEEAREQTGREEARLTELTTQRERARATLLSTQSEQLASEQRERNAGEHVEQLRERRASGESRKSELESAIEQKTQDKRANDDEAERLGQSLETLAERVEELSSEVARLESVRDEATEAATRAKVALAKWQQRRDGLVAAIERMARQVNQERERQATLEADAASNATKAEELERAIESLAAEHETLLKSETEASGAAQAAKEAHEARRIELDELQLKLRKLRQTHEERREQFTEVQSGLRELEMDRELIRSSVEERFDVELELLVFDYHDRELATSGTRERADELKRLIARMGEVNLTAIAEYEDVVERYDYLTRQRKDLEDAIAQLQEAIDQINQTTRERFKETFDLVNEKFQALFPRLFAGGRAELVLTQPDDLLATGVEIMAQPPGKKVSSLELLSGGEKALTAVSLIFGIFLIKPSPFCLLDEVDAPLDEANVGRFCDLIKELAEDTQFIIITHNKRSMEIADRLYGVTMQQRGVSKLVSVNMSKAVRDAEFEAGQVN